MDSVAPNISLEFNGPAEGLDSAGYAKKWQVVFNGGVALAQEQTTIGGQAAIILKGIPGMFSGQGAFMVANGAKYALMVFPEPGQVTAIDADIQRGWDVIANSLTFFSPEAALTMVKPEDVCPKESTDAHVYISERDGYCYLYPIDFAVDPQFQERVTGGPVLTNDPSFGGDIRTNINVGTFGYFPGQTPRQVIESWMEFIDTSLADGHDHWKFSSGGVHRSAGTVAQPDGIRECEWQGLHDPGATLRPGTFPGRDTVCHKSLGHGDEQLKVL